MNVADLIDAVMQISTPVKVAWIICLVWAVAQREWYGRARSEESETARPEAVSGEDGPALRALRDMPHHRRPVFDRTGHNGP